jgi:predicted anti-sigma-YlaC factor YlaD
MECERFREHLNAYVAERLEGVERLEWRDHLRGCRDCRGWALGEEPTLWLAVEAPSVAEPARVEACVTAVTTMARQQTISRRLSGGRRWVLAAAAVAVLALGGLLWSLGGMGGGVVTADGRPVDSGLPAPDLEVEMEGEGVRVYQFTGDGEEDTVVAFVVNPALDS